METKINAILSALASATNLLLELRDGRAPTAGVASAPKVAKQDAPKCAHIISSKSKSRSGQQCSSKVSAKSATGKYCAKHLKYEKTPSVPSVRTTTVQITKTNASTYIMDNGFIVDQENRVIAKQSDKGPCSLSKRDIETCKERNLKYVLPKTIIDDSDVPLEKTEAPTLTLPIPHKRTNTTDVPNHVSGDEQEDVSDAESGGEGAGLDD